jgi:hypothetical protein
MIPPNSPERRNDAAAEFDAHERRNDGLQVVNSLCYGMTSLRNLLFVRIHEDVEKNVGRDSMMMPVSALACEEKTKLEIEVFQLALSTATTQRKKYVGDTAWYARWMGKLRLGDHATDPANEKRLARYLALTDEERRLGFSRVLEKAFPEAMRAPLVLYRLFPLAVAIVTAAAFRDAREVEALREQQITWLPSIRDCQDCRGRPLDNGEQCPVCGNPVWSYAWLTYAD